MVACTLPVGRRHGGAHRDAAGGAGAQIHARIPADQSSARLPGLRQGRRVRTAGHGVPLRRRREPLHRRPSCTSTKSSGRRWSSTTRPRCILCFRCVRICNEGMGVGALGIINRGAVSEIAPNDGDHLECDECGMCIDICPVGALTSGAYRYKTRPWEMEHVGTICTHCSNGCKTTLGVAQRRDHPRQQSRPLRHQRRVPLHQGPLRVRFLRSSRAAAIAADARQRQAGAGVLVEGAGRRGARSSAKSKAAAASSASSVPTTPPTKRISTCRSSRARCWGPNNIDHHRTGDVVTLLDALSGNAGALATTADLYKTKAVLVVGADLALEHPFLSFQIRANYRHHQAHVYVVTPEPVREDKYARGAFGAAGRGTDCIESLRDKLQAEPELVILFGDADPGRRRAQAGGVRRHRSASRSSTSAWWTTRTRAARWIWACPELLPGYTSAAA